MSFARHKNELSYFLSCCLYKHCKFEPKMIAIRFSNSLVSFGFKFALARVKLEKNCDVINICILSFSVSASPEDEPLMNFRWHIFPTINPDGHAYTHNVDRFWSKNRRLNLSGKKCTVDQVSISSTFYVQLLRS